MDRIMVINEDGETTLDVKSSLYNIVVIDPDKRESWTRSTVQVAGGVRRAVLDPLQLAARLSIGIAELMVAVKAAIRNADLPIDADEVLENMTRIILEREAEEKANAE